MESGKLLSYLSLYMHKMYEDVERVQEGKTPHCGTDYYIWEKMNCFLRELQEIGIDKFKEDIEKLTMKDMKELYYFTIG